MPPERPARMERDSMGEMEVMADAYYGASGGSSPKAQGLLSSK